MRFLIVLFAPLLASCAGQSPSEAVSACKSAVELGERYASTIDVIKSEVKAKTVTREEAADALLGHPFLNKSSFEELTSQVAPVEPAELNNSVEFPQGNLGNQARLLRAFLDRLSAAPEPGILTTDITYDVDNGNGVPERRQASCKFLMSNTHFREPLIPYSAAIALEKSRQSNFGPTNVPNKGYKCCVPEFVLAKIDARYGQPVNGGVIMQDEVESAVNAAFAEQRSKDAR